MRFWDASAVVPLLLLEDRSADLRANFEADPAGAAWWGTRFEVVSAIRRREREGLIEAGDATVSIERLRALMMSWAEIAPSPRVGEAVERTLALHPLRAADALQLAAALTWARGAPAGRVVVCLDERLRDAARREGFTLAPDRP